MKNEIAELLQTSKNPLMEQWRKYHSGEYSLDDLLLETYLYALEPHCFNGYRYRPAPPKPLGFEADYQESKSVSGKNAQSEAWQALTKKYPGYFNALWDGQLANNSDWHFLREMLTFFEAHTMPSQADKVRQRLMEFRAI